MRLPDHVLPDDVRKLLRALDSAEREASWAQLVANYSPRILGVTRTVFSQHDDAMDGYAHVLDQLRSDNYRRIRSYPSDGRCNFTTWLFVVVRRLCIDYARQKYGRTRELGDGSSREIDRYRRQLAASMQDVIDPETLPAGDGTFADASVRSQQLARTLDAVIAELSIEDRLFLKLRFCDDLTVNEIGKLLAFRSQFHAFRRLKWILATLRTKLRERGIDESAP